jgi:hypothetical protein
MKNYMYVIALLSISFMSTDIYSQFKFEKPSIPGLTGDKEETESSGNPADAAAKLESDLRSALVAVAKADELIKLAYGDKDGAAQAAARADKLNNGGDVKGAIEETKSSAEANAKLAEEQTDLDAESKKKLAAAIPPYLKAIYKTTQLSKSMKDFADEAKNALKEVRTNPMKLRKVQKSLSTGMMIAKNGPGLIKGLATNGKKLVTSAKSQGVEVDDDDVAGSI